MGKIGAVDLAENLWVKIRSTEREGWQHFRGERKETLPNADDFAERITISLWEVVTSYDFAEPLAQESTEESTASSASAWTPFRRKISVAAGSQQQNPRWKVIGSGDIQPRL